MKNANFYLMTNTLGDMIRVARIAKGWSQRELARRIKKSPTYVHYVERGINPSSKSEKMRVGVEAVDMLAKALDISVDAARNAAGYAPLFTPDMIRIELPDDVSVLLPNARDITSQEDLERFEIAFRVAYETVKERIRKSQD